ncbi:MAG: hypothetical protein NTV94_08720 [Planctomycetota bacterium]|nr:hypothetical protein [Planctomycetota bacterium]
MDQAHLASRNAAHWTSRLLSAIVGGAVVAGVLGFTGSGALIGPAAAQAQPAGQPGESDDANGRISAADQRKEMISQLRNLSVRMERMDALLSKGINVKVTQMPASSSDNAAPSERAAAPAPRSPSLARPSSK